MFARLLLLCCWLTMDVVADNPLLRYRAGFKASGTEFVDTVSVEWENQQLYVPLYMGGRAMRFLLDTGAGMSVVYNDQPIEGSMTVGKMPTRDALGHNDTVPVVMLPPMQIGKVVLKGCKATMQRRFVRQPGVDGILGFDLFASGVLAKIDVRNRQLIITNRKGWFDNEKGFDAKYSLKYHTPYLRLSPFGKYHEEACFDTGSRAVYMMNRQSLSKGEEKCSSEVIKDLVEGHCIGRHAMGHSGTEQRGEVLFLHLQQLRIGRLTLSGVHALTTQGNSHVGAALLQHAAVIIDPRRHRLRFQPYEDGDVCHVNNQPVEIAFVAEDGRPTVGLVWPQGIPYRQGFREGDVITHIDGLPVLTLTQFFQYPFVSGREHVFTVTDVHGLCRDIRWVRTQK